MRGGKKSLFKQSREQKNAKSAVEIKRQEEPALVSPAIPRHSPPPTAPESSMEGMSGIHEEVMSMISNMSAEEMQETLQSFLSSMQNPNTLQLLQNRIARSSENEVHQLQEAPIHAKASSAVSESSKSPYASFD